MALQASAPGELRGAPGRLGYLYLYLCARGAKAIFVAAADHSTLPGPSRAPQTSTQHHPLSAIFNNRLVCGAREGTGSVLWSAAATNIAFAPPAQR